MAKKLDLSLKEEMIKQSLTTKQKKKAKAKADADKRWKEKKKQIKKINKQAKKIQESPDFKNRQGEEI